MMSRNSIRLIKGQNRIELIYRVNSESLKMLKKKSMNFTSSETHTACEQKRSLIHFPAGTKMTLRRGSYCTALVVSMITIFISAPDTIVPLNTNYVTEAISQIQSFYWITGRREFREPCYYDIPQASNLTEIHIFCSEFRHGSSCRRCPHNVLLGTSQSNPLVVELQRYLPFHGKCAFLFTKSLTWEGCFFLMCHNFVKCFTKNQPQNKKWTKTFHVWEVFSPLCVQDIA